MPVLPQSENPYASPQSEEAPVLSNPTPTWRDGELVVVAASGSLPKRCVKCGRPAEESVEEAVKVTKIAYRPRAVVFSIVGMLGSLAYIYSQIQRPTASFLNPLGVGAIGCIASLVVAALYATRIAESVTVASVYCSKHSRLRRLLQHSILVVWLSLLMIYGYDRYVGQQWWRIPGLIPLVTLPLVFLSAVVQQATYVTIRLERKAAGNYFLSGFGKPFVDSLPPYEESVEASSAANDDQQ